MSIDSSRRVSCVMVLDENQRCIDSVFPIASALLLCALTKTEDNVRCSFSDGMCVVFTCAIKTANGLASAPIADLPDALASSITVPVPQKGSSTNPSAGQK